MAVKSPNTASINDKFLAKKRAAKQLLLARKALEDAQELDKSRMMERALDYCELASACLDSSESGFVLEWDSH